MDFDVELKEMAARRGKDRKVAITVMFPPSIINEIDDEAAKHRLSRGDFLIVCFLRTRGVGDTPPVVNPSKKTDAQIRREYEVEFNRRIDMRHADGTFYSNPITVAEEMRLENWGK